VVWWWGEAGLSGGIGGGKGSDYLLAEIIINFQAEGCIIIHTSKTQLIYDEKSALTIS
jgi:hypothetical protein